jgi:hypothetical protein
MVSKLFFIPIKTIPVLWGDLQSLDHDYGLTVARRSWTVHRLINLSLLAKFFFPC